MSPFRSEKQRRYLKLKEFIKENADTTFDVRELIRKYEKQNPRIVINSEPEMSKEYIQQKQLERNKEIEKQRAEYEIERAIEAEFRGFKLDDRVITLVSKKGFIHTGTMPAGITGTVVDFLDNGEIMVDFDYEFNGQASEPFLPNEIEHDWKEVTEKKKLERMNMKLSNFLSEETEENKIHDEIVDLIYKYGEKFEKHHGNWYRLRYSDDSWFVMDSYNKGVWLEQGDIKYDNIYTGFTGGKKIAYLGMDFGGRSPADVPVERMKMYLDVLKGRIEWQNKYKKGVNEDGRFDHVLGLVKIFKKEYPMDWNRWKNDKEMLADGIDGWIQGEFGKVEQYDLIIQAVEELLATSKNEAFSINSEGLSYEARVIFNRPLKKAEQENAKAIAFYWGKLPYVSVEGVMGREMGRDVIVFLNKNTEMKFGIDLTKTASDDPGFHNIEDKLGTWLEQGTPKRKDGTQKFPGLGNGVVKTVGVDYP